MKNNHRQIFNLSFIFLLFVLSSIMIGQGETFTTFSTGELTGGGAASITSLDVSGLTEDYLFYVVSADFIGGANPAYSETIEMELNNGGSTLYKASSGATTGALQNGNSTTLIWSGIMNEVYAGGGNFTIKLLDSFTDGSGPYTSTLNNVTVTIYYAPTPIKSFSSFSTGELTGGGASSSTSLDVSGLTYDYLFYVVSADFVGGTNPAYSETIEMELNNGGSTVYKASSGATTGSLQNGNSTTLIWSGNMNEVYAGGGNFTIKLLDIFTDASGPYTSTLNNVSVKIYPATSPQKDFASYSTGTLTGGGAASTTSLGVSGLTDDYLFYVVSADFVGGANPAYSETIKMELNNGGSTVYKTSSSATTGSLQNGNSTTLIWSGIMNEVYEGGGDLTIKLLDSFTDGSGPYTSTLNNVSVKIYSVPSSTPVPVELVSFTALVAEDFINLNWETATEINNYGFDIERTLSGVEEWETLGFVEGHGNSYSPKNYEFIDENPPNSVLEYRLKQIDTDGQFEYYATVLEVDAKSITSVEDNAQPKELKLIQNYPNPFNPSTTIRYSIPDNDFVKLTVYNLLGKEVASLVNEEKQAGNYKVEFNAESVAGGISSGVYFYKLQTNSGFTSTRKFILMK